MEPDVDGTRLRQKLDEERRKLDGLFAISADLMCIADQRGFFSKVSPSFEDILGWPRQQVEGTSWLDYIHPDDVEPTIEEGQLAGQRPGVDFLNRYRTKSGEWRWIRWRTTTWGAAGEACAIGRDITDDPEMRDEFLRLANQREMRKLRS